MIATLDPSTPKTSVAKVSARAQRPFMASRCTAGNDACSFSIEVEEFLHSARYLKVKRELMNHLLDTEVA